VAKVNLPFELAKKVGKNAVELDGASLKELFEKARSELGVDLAAEAKKLAVLINGRNIHYLKGWSTPIKADDEIWFVAGSGGG